MHIDGVSVASWAQAISLRIADEWHSESAEDKEVLRVALEMSLINTPEAIKLLIGTEIIEENHFEFIE
jgi:hypothetical protein